uniref:Retrotransposon gag domain-containing protein n=1 Tax=Cacopsylla melanoneura TaxID=428564 RepID=A0A8D8WUW2_9HEMI
MTTTSLGQVSVLNQSSDARAWLQQFEVYCTLNDIPAAKKVLLFISYLGTEPYKILRELCLPSAPNEKTFAQLKTILTDFVAPAPNFLMQRYHFRDRRQQPEESLQEYVKELKKLSEFCMFSLNSNGDLHLR